MSRRKNQALARECALVIAQIVQDNKGKLPSAIEAPVKALSRHASLLSLAWSNMAARNLIGDILRTLALIEPKLGTKTKLAAQALRKRAQQRMGEHDPTKAGYDNALCLAYRVKTAGDSFAGKSSDYQDMLTKCSEMKKAIRAAYKLVSSANHRDGRMLKIFMAPEFFFRGKNGGYNFDDVLGLVEGKTARKRVGLLELLQQEVSRPIYKDWLFVLDTVIALSQNTEKRCKSCQAGLEEKDVKGVKKLVCKGSASHVLEDRVLSATVDNIAYVCKEKEVYTVSKELVSHIDFVTRTDPKTGKETKDEVSVKGATTKVERHAQPSGYEAATGTSSRFTDERMGGSIFTIDGITFGLEVCLDHAASTKSPSAGRLDHAANIQVQLIPSAGMWIQQFRTVKDGIVFNVDGSVPHVQVAGFTGNGMELHESVVIQGNARNLHMASGDWDPGTMAASLDLQKAVGGGNWQSTAAVSSGPAPNGVVLQYGPFEIPKV
jgi:hypothetical protein